jgi:hypothetical protein
MVDLPCSTSNSLKTTNIYADGDPMDIAISSSTFYPVFTKPDQAVSTSVSRGETPSPASENTSITQNKQSATFKVSISMLCTNAQLEAVMGTVVSTGTCVTIKIDPKT